MNNILIYLIGFPGTGKYTIAKEICRQADFKLVDNHLINNPVLSLVDLTGKSGLPADVQDTISIIRHAVFHTIETISPRHFNSMRNRPPKLF